MSGKITATGISKAVKSIDPVFLDSPLVDNRQADELLGCKLHLKVESINPIRSFKGRGAEWFMASIGDDDQLLVAASAGNFGQGLAYAARSRRRKLVMFAATSANKLKIAAMRDFGAEVILSGDDFDGAKDAARQYAQAKNGMFIEDGAIAEIAEGAGTIALEVDRQLKTRKQTIDTMIVPLGNGALISGIGTWIRAHMPDCRVIGVVAEKAPSMLLSWQQGTIITTLKAPTIADGIAVRVPVPEALAAMADTVDEVISVSEDAIRQAMAFSLKQYGLVGEAAGVAGLAAIIEHKDRLAGHEVATIMCGSNIA